MAGTQNCPRLFALLLTAVTALAIWGGQPASAQTRVALVIGNSDYRDLGPLANPANDADLMAESLRGLDFEVMVSTDLDQKSMKRAIKAFGRRLDEAGSDSVGLFYYAGHGVQVDGANFLIPIG
ncbi:MAG: caspase family protein, partial [Geminicoccaceae bacterium]